MRVLFVFLVFMGSPYALMANCTSVLAPVTSDDLVGVNVEATAQGLLTGIRRGANAWNTAPCVNRYINPFPYPEFSVLTQSSAKIRVRVVNEVGNEKVASIIINPSNETAVIQLYAHYGFENGDELPLDWSDPDVVADVITHELGHYLGLQHVPCYGHIMDEFLVTRDASGNAKISPAQELKYAECAVADHNSITDWEQQELDCIDDPDCNPDVACGPFCCPIIIDFDRDGFKMSAGPIQFDIDSDGNDDLLTWSAAKEADGFLAMDRNSNGLIDDGAELFGSGTPLPSGVRAPHGYIALRALDSPENGGNDDGWLSAEDRSFKHLLIWIDRNQNGVSEHRELLRAHRAGLVAIDLQYWYDGSRDSHGNEFKFLSLAVIRTKGKLVETLAADVFFRPVELHRTGN